MIHAVQVRNTFPKVFEVLEKHFAGNLAENWHAYGRSHLGNVFGTPRALF